MSQQHRAAPRPPQAPRPTDPGPFEDLAWPEQLVARVVAPSSAAAPGGRLHGYDILGDLLLHYSFAEVLLLCLTGELPQEQHVVAFERALVAWSAAPVTEAPVHAGVLARLSGTPTRGLLGLGVVGLAEQAHAVVSRHRHLLESDRPTAMREADRGTCSEEEARKVTLLLDSLPEGFPDLAIENPNLEAAVVRVLVLCGLREPWQVETALVLGRLGTLAAEVHAHRPGALTEYPMNLPPFRYEEPDHE